MSRTNPVGLDSRRFSDQYYTVYYHYYTIVNISVVKTWLAMGPFHLTAFQPHADLELRCDLEIHQIG